MPSDTPPIGDSVETPATDAHLQKIFGAEPETPAAKEPEPQPETLLAKRFKSVGELEKGYEEVQKEMNRMQAAEAGLDEIKGQAALANKYKTLLDTVQTDEGFAEHVMGWDGFNAEARQEPSDERPLTRSEVTQIMRAEATRATTESTRQARYSNELEQIAAEEKIPIEEIQTAIGELGKRELNARDMWEFVNMQKRLAAAKGNGRDEVLGSMRDAQERIPAIGATPGASDPPRDLYKDMGAEIVAESQKRDLF